MLQDGGTFDLVPSESFLLLQDGGTFALVQQWESFLLLQDGGAFALVQSSESLLQYGYNVSLASDFHLPEKILEAGGKSF